LVKIRAVLAQTLTKLASTEQVIALTASRLPALVLLQCMPGELFCCTALYYPWLVGRTFFV